MFSGLGRLKENYTIELERNATPYALSRPQRVQIPLRGEVCEKLDRMEAMGVISKVTQPTDWCAGMVVVPMANGKIRISVDLTHLNTWVKRERHILPSVDRTLAQLSGAKVFSKLETRAGFWQIPLARESALLTTFITPYGRYCFNRLLSDRNEWCWGRSQVEAFKNLKLALSSPQVLAQYSPSAETELQPMHLLMASEPFSHRNKQTRNGGP